MSHATPSQRATAVARVMAGESRRKVAEDMGVSDSTVGGWVKLAESRETEQGQSLADRAALVADQIVHWETIALDRLIQRIAELAEKTEDLGAATKAYKALGEKALLRAGKPTAIHEHRDSDPLDAEIAQLVSEEAAKRHGDAARDPA